MIVSSRVGESISSLKIRLPPYSGPHTSHQKKQKMISALYILDLKGKIIISRDYRGDIPINYVERFVTKILEEEEASLKPIFEEDGVSYIYIKHNNLYGMK
jgi:hypothetical protein